MPKIAQGQNQWRTDVSYLEIDLAKRTGKVTRTARGDMGKEKQGGAATQGKVGNMRWHVKINVSKKKQQETREGVGETWKRQGW